MTSPILTDDPVGPRADDAERGVRLVEPLPRLLERGGQEATLNSVSGDQRDGFVPATFPDEPVRQFDERRTHMIHLAVPFSEAIASRWAR